MNTKINSRVLDLGKVMRGVYFKMFLGILLTAIASFVFLTYFPTAMMFMVTHSVVFWGLAIVEFLFVIILSGRLEKMKKSTAKLMFYIFAVLNGITMAPIFLCYTATNISIAFFITAAMFGIMSAYGYITKRDLSGWGDFLLMALIGLIICLIVQFFWHNTMFAFLVSCAAVLIFTGLTAWDTQMIKEMIKNTESDDEVDKISTFGALSLYLDFINLFLHILRILGAINK